MILEILEYDTNRTGYFLNTYSEVTEWKYVTITSFMIHIRKKVIGVWTNMKVSRPNWSQNCHFGERKTALKQIDSHSYQGSPVLKSFLECLHNALTWITVSALRDDHLCLQKMTCTGPLTQAWWILCWSIKINTFTNLTVMPGSKLKSSTVLN